MAEPGAAPACGEPIHLALGRLREPVDQLAAGRGRKDAAVERREGARAYVTGARDTLAIRPRLRTTI